MISQYPKEISHEKIRRHFMILLVCCSLCGCTYWQEEDGTSHFMLWGERGPMKDGKPMPEEEISALSEDTTKTDTAASNKPPSFQSTQNNTIKGVHLKQGWTSDDPSLLKGSHVVITNNIELLTVSMVEHKEVTIHMNAELEQGEYQVVISFPDQSQRILFDTNTNSKSQTIDLNAGTNSIWLLSESVSFNSIDLSIDGLEVSDFS